MSDSPDVLAEARDATRGLSDSTGLVGYGVVEIIAPDGTVKSAVPFHNLITDAGDGYYAAMSVAGVSPATPSSPTLVTGMKLGTGATAAAKNSSGHALGVYISGSNATFDTSYPQTSNLGAGLGVEAVYKCTWAAGTATNSAITEVVIVTDASADATSAGADTISRAVFTAQDKGEYDGMSITWYHKYLGA